MTHPGDERHNARDKEIGDKRTKKLFFLSRWAVQLDLLTAFVVFGYGVGHLAGTNSEGGIKLDTAGWVVTAVLIAAYFWIGHKFLGGTLWQRILRVR